MRQEGVVDESFNCGYSMTTRDYGDIYSIPRVQVYMLSTSVAAAFSPSLMLAVQATSEPGCPSIWSTVIPVLLVGYAFVE